MKKVVNTLKSLWKDESAQGATEYILLLVIVVAVAMIFKGKIRDMITTKTDDLAKSVQGFTGDN